jgi:hypothetical protein
MSRNYVMEIKRNNETKRKNIQMVRENWKIIDIKYDALKEEIHRKKKLDEEVNRVSRISSLLLNEM